MNSLELKIPPAVFTAVLALLMWLTQFVAPALSYALPGQALVMLPITTIGMILSVLGAAAFRREETTVDPTRPELSSTLVVSGVYRISRNPMYLGFLLVLAGWGLHIANLLALLALPVYVIYLTRFQILPEERALGERFGEAYSDYRRRVRRWL